MQDTTRENPASTPHYYPIDGESARRAHELMSFRDYKPGSKTAEYRRMVDAAAELAERQKKRTDPMHHEKIDRLLDAYARRLAENMNKASRIGCMCPSIMIAGGSNFPTRKKERQNKADEKNMQDFEEIQGLLRKIESVGKGGISSDDPQAIEKLQAKLDKLTHHQELMKAANAAIRMKDKEKGDKRLAELGYTQEEITELRAPDFAGRIGYPAYALQNNNANIRRIRQRVEELKKRQTEPDPEGWTFDGGEVVINTDLNRLQIVLNDRPDEDMRTALKSHGFRWAPSQGAWQRQYTSNSVWAARKITGKKEIKEW